MDVPIGWIKVEMIGAVAHHRAMSRDRCCLEIVLGDGLLEFAAPLRSAFGHGMGLYWTAIGIPKRDIATANEAESGVVEVVAVELIDRHSERTGAHKRVYDLVVEEHVNAGYNLIRVVLANGTLSGPRIIGRPNARGEQKVGVMQYKRAHDHDFCGLLKFLALFSYVGNAGGALAVLVLIYPDDLGSGPKLEVRLAHQNRQDRCLWACLGVVAAAKFFAKTAVAALSEGYPEWIGIGS